MNTPNDTNILAELLQAQIAQNNDLRAQLSQQTTLIETLQQQLATLQRMLFGQKSEKQRKPNLNNDPALSPIPANGSGKDTTQNKRNGRRRFPESLERVVITHDLPESQKICSCCASTLKRIGEETTEQLDFVPAKLIVNRHVKYKYICKHCQGPIQTATMPEQPIAKGAAGSGLLAEVLINKYDDALPLYRQERRWERLGYHLPRSSLCDWVLQCAQRLKPIVDAMRQQCLLIAQKIHTDDTTVPVLASGKTHTGRLWVYLSGGHAPPCVIYQYSKTRAKSVPLKFLEGYRGYIQADAYPGYNALYETGERIEVACMAHARRKFTDIQKTVKSSVLVEQAINFFAKLYNIDETF